MASLLDLKEDIVSPSQGQIGTSLPLKRDHDSMDDFEHITKEASPVKDAYNEDMMEKVDAEKDPKGTNLDSFLSFGDSSNAGKKESNVNKSGAIEVDDTSLDKTDYKDLLVDMSEPTNNTNTFPMDFAPTFATSDDKFGSSKNFMHYERGGSGPDAAAEKDLLDFLSQEVDKPSQDDADDHDADDHDVSTASNDSIQQPAGISSSLSFPDFGKDEEVEVLPEPTPPSKPEVEISEPEPEPNAPKISPKADIIFPSPRAELQVKEEVDIDASDEDSAPPPLLPRDYPEIGVMEPKAIFSAIGLDTWFHPGRLNPKVEALVYWRDPKKSGIVFGSVLTVLLSLTLFSLISVIAYTSLLVLVAAVSFRIYKNVLQAVQKTSEGHPFNIYLIPVLLHPVITIFFDLVKEYLDVDVTLNPDKAREVTDVAVAHLNTAVTELRRRFLVEDLVDSIKFGMLLWCLTYLGSWFNGLSLLIIAFVGLFTLPKVYENNKTQIDANLEIVKAKINDVTDKIKAVIPIGKKPESEAKDKDE